MVNPKNGFLACKIMANGMPEPDCRFLDNTNDVTSSGYTGSLMYKQFLPQVRQHNTWLIHNGIL